MTSTAPPIRPRLFCFTRFGCRATRTPRTPKRRTSYAGTPAKTPCWLPANPPSGRTSARAQAPDVSFGDVITRPRPDFQIFLGNGDVDLMVPTGAGPGRRVAQAVLRMQLPANRVQRFL